MSYPTWSDLNSPSIVPPIGARQAPDIGPYALMVSTAPDLGYITANSGKYTGVPFFNGSLYTSEDGAMSIAGPYIGAPYAVMLMESLIAKGATTIVILGWCGSLSKALVPGDLIVPSACIVDEGCSRHYQAFDREPAKSFPDEGVTRALEDFIGREGVAVNTGPVWTTDAIYRETRGKVDWYREQGAVAVEMECSALFAAAAYRKVKAAALLVVSDSLVQDDGKWAPGFRKKEFKTMRKTACCQALKFIKTMG